MLLRFTGTLTAVALAAVAMFGIAGCPNATSTGSGADLATVGVTTGGAEDIAQAREDLKSGLIPPSKSITVEGFMSEHDIPVATPDNAPEFFATASVAYRVPFGETHPVGDLFLNFGTTIDLNDFHRDRQNIVIAIDRSGSMNDPASDTSAESKIVAVRKAIASLMNQLDEHDRVALVSFGIASTVDVGAVAGNQRAAINDAAGRLKVIGDTNLISGLNRAFEELRKSAGGGGRANRVIMFTDALATLGQKKVSDLLTVVRQNAEDEMYFTLMGIGADYDDRLASNLHKVHGANAFYLGEAGRIATVFDQDFDFLVTPAAFDVTLTVQIADQIGIRDVYGVENYTPGQNFARVKLPTLFFSKREGGGAVIVRLTTAETPTFATDTDIGSLSLTYTLANGARRAWNTDLVLPAGISPTADPAYYSDDGARRAALLLDTALVLHNAARSVEHGRRSVARESLVNFQTYFQEAQRGLSDRTNSSSRSLSDESDLIDEFIGDLGSYYSYD